MKMDRSINQNQNNQEGKINKEKISKIVSELKLQIRKLTKQTFIHYWVHNPNDALLRFT